MNRMGWTIFVLSGALIGASACNRDSDAVMAKINETNKRLDSIEQKLDALARAGGARGNGKRNRRRGPEPGVLYAVPVNDNDAYRGGANAKVTIVDAFEYA